MNTPSPRINIRRIAATQTAAVRHAILWPSIPIDAQLLPFDHLATTIHLGAFDADADSADDGLDSGPMPIGVLTITLEAYTGARTEVPRSFSESFEADKAAISQYQLHKFALLPAYRGRGIGRSLLAHATDELEVIMTQQHLDVVLFHFDARVSQRDLYQHLGYSVLDDKVFIKYGSTGKGPGVEYIKMGRVIRRHGRYA